jgi:hypothetical protein
MANHTIKASATKTPPMTGLCSYALAFSTLLSSQGTDAHLWFAFAFLGGFVLKLTRSNPYRQTVSPIPSSFWTFQDPAF